MSNTYIGIKRETTFPIIVGGNTLINLQKLLLYILADKTEEEIKQAAEKIQKQQYEEEWHEHYAFLALMISHIERVAHEKGLTEVENLEEPSSSTEN